MARVPFGLTTFSLSTGVLSPPGLLGLELLALPPEAAAGQFGHLFFERLDNFFQLANLAQIATVELTISMGFSPQANHFLAQARLKGRRHALHPSKKRLLCPAQNTLTKTNRSPLPSSSQLPPNIYRQHFSATP
jgi:hypothetical protein